MPEWCLCSVRPVWFVGGYGLILVRGNALLFVVFGVLTGPGHGLGAAYRAG